MATPDEERRAETRRSALIIGGILGAVFLALAVAVLAKNGSPFGATEVRTGEEWKQLPDGKRAQARGTVARVSEVLSFTVVEIKLEDGATVTCYFDLHFGKNAPRSAYTGSDLKDWARQLRAGSELSVIGRANRTPPSLHECDTVPPIKRVR
jgi:hypothetical protein